jgi:hypothetical protein
MSETFRQQVERVLLMSTDSGETWDLSPNDQAALKAVLQRMAVLDAQCDELLSALKRARQFIRNGIEWGYITMPEWNSRDSAIEVPAEIDAVIAKAEGDADH